MWNFITGKNRRVAELIVSQQEFGRPFMAPPGIPPEPLKLLRDAFNAAMKDPELIAEATKMKLGLSPKTGEEVAAIVKKLYAATPDLVERARQILRP